MLEKLLALLEKDGVHQPSELAARLGVSRALVEQMLGFLIAAGKVQQLPGSSLICTGTSCPSCAVADACAHLGRLPNQRDI